MKTAEAPREPVDKFGCLQPPEKMLKLHGVLYSGIDESAYRTTHGRLQQQPPNFLCNNE